MGLEGHPLYNMLPEVKTPDTSIQKVSRETYSKHISFYEIFFVSRLTFEY